MIILSAQDLGYAVGDRTILQNISFSIGEGDRVGVIGANGAGKTTLFRLITGDYAPSSGQIFLARGRTVGLLAQNAAEAGVVDETPLLESMYLTFPHLLALEGEIARLEQELEATPPQDEARIARLSGELSRAHTEYASEGGLEFRTRCRSVLKNMGFLDSELSLPLSALSGGQHTRLSLSRLICREPDILMLDEPTNHLDIAALDWLETYLSSYKKTLIVISHDRYFLDSVTSKTLKIERGTATLYRGNYSEACRQEAERLASNLRAWKERQKQIAKIEANIAFQRRCGQEHNFVTIRSKQKQLERMERDAPPPPPPRARGIHLGFGLSARGGEEVVEAKHLSFSFGEKPLIDDLSFLIRRGERVLILGANGCGKSTLLRLILGELTPRGGSVRLGHEIKPGYYEQETHSLSD